MIAGGGCACGGLVREIGRSRELARQEKRLAEVESERDSRIVVRAQRERSPKQLHRGPDVVPPERACADGREQRRGAEAEVTRTLVQRPELAPVPVRLLEVIADELVRLDELRRAFAEPVREALVQLCACRLRKRLVRRVANQQVSEPICVLAFEL